MATFRKRNGKWQAIVRHKDIGTTSRSFTSKCDAIKWTREQERQLENDDFGTLEPTSVTFGDLLSRYARGITHSNRGATTALRRLRRLINDPVSSISVHKLSPARVSAFRDQRIKDGVRAAHYDLILIRHCLKIAINEWGLMLSSNPVDKVKMPPASKPRQRRLNDGEFDRLKAASASTLNPHIWLIIVFAIETGMRRSEILGLEWHQVDFNRQTALLPITKNGSTREVPLSHKALDVLRRQKARNDTPTPFPVNANSLRLAWDRLRARAGLSELRFHDLRHEAISRFFEMGLNMPEVAVISGHRDPRMLFRYTHLRAEDLLPKLNQRVP